MLDGKPETYREFAKEYYERNILLSAVKRIYKHRPITYGLIASLNPDVSFADLKADIETIVFRKPLANACRAVVGERDIPLTPI
jgi:hypothetical protein